MLSSVPDLFRWLNFIPSMAKVFKPLQCLPAFLRRQMPIAFQTTKGTDGFDPGGPPHNLPSFDARVCRACADCAWKQHKGTIPLVSQKAVRGVAAAALRWRLVFIALLLQSGSKKLRRNPRCGKLPERTVNTPSPRRSFPCAASAFSSSSWEYHQLQLVDRYVQPT